MKREAEIRRRKRRTRILTVWIIILAIIASIGGGIYSFIHTSNNSNMTSDNPSVQTQTNENTESEQPEESDNTSENSDSDKSKASENEELPEETDSEEDTETTSEEDDENADSAEAADSGCEIYIDKTHGFKCPYPSSFEVGTLSNKNTRLSIKDPEGDGEMLISYEKISEAQKASILMRDYVKGIGVEPEYNRAGNNWYEVTFIRGGKFNHRKAVITDGTKYVYYDFTYSVDSESKTEYEKYIEFADSYLEKNYPESSETDKEESSKKN